MRPRPGGSIPAWHGGSVAPGPDEAAGPGGRVGPVQPREAAPELGLVESALHAEREHAPPGAPVPDLGAGPSPGAYVFRDATAVHRAVQPLFRDRRGQE